MHAVAQRTRIMPQKSRMAKTFGCLVGAMTLGTALLMWVESALSPGPPAPPAAGGIVLQAVDTAPLVRWRGITVTERVVARGRTMAGEWLDAEHFVVDHDGEVLCTSLWQQQRPVARRFDVRVCYLVRPSQTEVTPGQWTGLLKLLRALQGRFGIRSDRVELRLAAPRPLPAVAAEPSRARHERLKQMLRSVQLDER